MRALTLEDVKQLSISIESSLVGIFWKNPELMHDYSDIKQNMFINPLWKVYFSIGKLMVNKGATELDEVSVDTFLLSQSQLREKYIASGGYDKVALAMELANKNNIEFLVSELKKCSAVYSYISNLTITDEAYQRDLKDLGIDELYSYLTAQLNQVFINTTEGVNTERLDEGLEELISEADEGLSKGLPINSPILNDTTGGLISGQITLFGGLSGTGKTTITQEVHLSAIWELEEPCLIILNEQPRKKWTQQFLTWIINNKLLQPSDKKFTARRWRDGHFTAEEKQLLAKASQMLREKTVNNHIILAELDSYTQKKAERLIRKYAALGVKYFVLDTFKLSSDTKGDLYWLSMQEDMRKFDDLVKPAALNVHLWVTLQLSKGSIHKRYLSEDNLALSKGVLDVASVAVLMRSVRNDEYEGGKNQIDVVMPLTDDYATGSGRKVILDPRKHYVVLFIIKNRNGVANTYQIVCENDLGSLRYKEVGVASIPFDS